WVKLSLNTRRTFPAIVDWSVSARIIAAPSDKSSPQYRLPSWSSTTSCWTATPRRLETLRPAPVPRKSRRRELLRGVIDGAGLGVREATQPPGSFGSSTPPSVRGGTARRPRLKSTPHEGNIG